MILILIYNYKILSNYFYFILESKKKLLFFFIYVFLFMFSYLPISINYSFNYGVILLVLFIFLLLSGLLSVIFYTNSLSDSFFNLTVNSLNSYFYYFLRFIHNTSANLFFLFIFFHIFKSWFYSSSKVFYVLILGIAIFLVCCAIAFFGYCLPMGQMSYWACIVIFSLLSVLPYGSLLITYLFGSFSISSRTLSLLFLLHFITPFVLLVLVILHLNFLHISLSSFSSFNNFFDNITFLPYFFFIDFYIFFLFLSGFFIILFFYSINLFESENFISFMSLVTPLHIYPDWFLLFPYACLRSVDIKWFGVLLLIFVLLFIVFIPFCRYVFKISVSLYWFHAFCVFFFLMFTFFGANAPVYPFSLLIIYFQFIFYFCCFLYLIYLICLVFF